MVQSISSVIIYHSGQSPSPVKVSPTGAGLDQVLTGAGCGELPGSRPQHCCLVVAVVLQYPDTVTVILNQLLM